VKSGCCVSLCLVSGWKPMWLRGWAARMFLSELVSLLAAAGRTACLRSLDVMGRNRPAVTQRRNLARGGRWSQGRW
jgi:hypothetical protein